MTGKMFFCFQKWNKTFLTCICTCCRKEHILPKTAHSRMFHKTFECTLRTLIFLVHKCISFRGHTNPDNGDEHPTPDCIFHRNYGLGGDGDMRPLKISAYEHIVFPCSVIIIAIVMFVFVVSTTDENVTFILTCT